MPVNCKRFEGKVAIVTAATAGIGLGIATRLGQEGAKLVICSRKQNNVDETSKQLRGQGIDCQGCACHVGNKEHLKQLVQLALDSYGKIDVLVSNAAVNPTSGPILDMPEGSIDKILDINIKSAILLVKEVRPHLKQGASITFISSYTAFNPASAPISMYAISKTAVVALTKALAEELGTDGIRVNAVAPGIVPTKFAAALVASDEAAQQQKNANMLKRFGTPADMAAAVAYLASDDASYVTAEALVVSGGLQSRL
jgi:dehydrogenase/reductase SDR family protein 4